MGPGSGPARCRDTKHRKAVTKRGQPGQGPRTRARRVVLYPPAARRDPAGPAGGLLPGSRSLPAAPRRAARA